IPRITQSSSKNSHYIDKYKKNNLETIQEDTNLEVKSNKNEYKSVVNRSRFNPMPNQEMKNLKKVVDSSLPSVIKKENMSSRPKSYTEEKSLKNYSFQDISDINGSPLESSFA
ncbi:unnamed protein product, partial [Sphagnum compactum]